MFWVMNPLGNLRGAVGPFQGKGGHPQTLEFDGIHDLSRGIITQVYEFLLQTFSLSVCYLSKHS